MIALPQDSQCRRCVHFVGVWSPTDSEIGERLICRAFRRGIPAPIIANEHDHRHPYPGDGGVMFEAANEV